MIPPEVVEQVRHSADIVDVIGGYVPLKRAGAKYKACSPFNKEKTPSFFVDPGRQMFKCFSSGHGGDVFKFLMLMENMTFPEAIRRLAQRYGIAVPESGPYDPKAKSQKEELFSLHAGVAAWWQKLLKNDPAAEPARAYLKSRDLDPELTDEFGLGYAPESWDATSTWARQAGYSAEALETSRLVATNEAGRRYDFFRGRLMIPIHDEAGQVVAFSGRLLDPEAKAQKYVNSPETPIFSKSRILFGLNRTKRPIIEQGSAVLCEGQIDLMRCWQKGIRNVVAPQGTAFTEQQAHTLRRLAAEVVICYDADRAGQNAAQRSIEVLLKEGLQIRVARIPAGEDPDSLLRKHPVELFETILHDAKDYTRHLLDVACEAEGDIASPRGRGAVAQKIAPTIARIPNAVQREAFLLEAAGRLQVPRAVLEEEVRKAADTQNRSEMMARRTQHGAQGIGAPDQPADAAPGELPIEPIVADKLVEALLSLLLTKPELVPQVTRDLDPAWLEGCGGAEVLLRLLDAHAHDAWEDAPRFLEECDDRTRDYLAGVLMEPPPLTTESSPETIAASLVSRARLRWTQRRGELLEQEIKSGLLEPGALMEKMRALGEVRAFLSQAAAPKGRR
jgi:DNA primase